MRRWFYSVDVEVGANGAPLVDLAGCDSFAGGTAIMSVPATPRALAASPTPCRFVWIGARVANDGTPKNQGPCWIGDSVNQNIPILPNNFDGVVIRINDANKVFWRSFVDDPLAPEGIEYRIFA